MSCRGGVKYALGVSAGGGGIYTTVETEDELIAALEAQDPLIYIAADIAATQDYSVTEDTEVRTGARCTLDMGGSYGFVVTAGYHFILSGDGRDVSNLTWNTSGAAHDLIQLGSGATAKVKDLHVTESAVSANAGALWTSGTQCTLDALRFTFANNTVTRFPSVLGPSGSALQWDDIEFVGGGSSCYGKVNSSGSSLAGSIANLKFIGSWSSSTFSMSLYSNANVSNVSLIGANTSALISCYSAKSITASSSQSITISAKNADGVKTTGTLALTAANTVATNLTTGTLTISQGGIRVTNFSTNTLTAHTRDACAFVNGSVYFGVSVSSGADRNAFIGVAAGDPLNPGTTYTITVDSGANDTTIVGCHTDVAISDSGTGTQLGINIVY